MRDYSSQASRHRASHQRGPSAALGITLSVVLLGLVTAGLIWLNQSTEPNQDTLSEQPKAVPQPTEVRGAAAPAETPTDATEVAIQEVPKAPENFYTFYQLLIEGEVPIDVQPGETRDEAIAKKLQSTLVQVASFRTSEAAESTRVALLFLDLKARVIPPSTSNGGWYRVVLGPFKTVRDMQAAADRLAKNGYDAQRVME
jgi:cell division protein FtsN